MPDHEELIDAIVEEVQREVRLPIGERASTTDILRDVLRRRLSPPAEAQEVERLRAERDEADRRAGAAERDLADLRDRQWKADRWMDARKEEAGHHHNVSLDVVWGDVFTYAKRHGYLKESP